MLASWMNGHGKYTTTGYLRFRQDFNALLKMFSQLFLFGRFANSGRPIEDLLDLGRNDRILFHSIHMQLATVIGTASNRDPTPVLADVDGKYATGQRG